MKIPDYFKFMGCCWRVVMEVPIDEEWGKTDFKTLTIYLRPDLSPQNIEASFVHELIHVIFWGTGLDKMLVSEADQEEVIVNSIANGIYALLSDGIIDVQSTETDATYSRRTKADSKRS